MRQPDQNQALDEEARDVRTLDPSKRQSEFSVSRGGMNQEDRRHNEPAPN